MTLSLPPSGTSSASIPVWPVPSRPPAWACWLETPWLLLLALPLTLPGLWLPLRYTPTLTLLLGLFWPLWLWGAWRSRARPTLLGWATVALLGSVALAVARAPDLRLAWVLAGHLGVGLALAVALLAWPPARRWPGLIALGLIALAAVLSVVGPPLVGGSALQNPRVAAFYAPWTAMVQAWGETLNANVLAGGLLPAIPLSVALALAPWGAAWWQRGLGLLRTSLLLGLAGWLVQVLTLTNSRAGLAAALLSLPLVVVLRWPRLRWSAAALVALGVGWLIVSDPWTQLQTVMADGMARDYNGRMEIWLRSWIALRRAPWTGIGLGGFIPMVVERIAPIREVLTPQVTHAHAWWLQVALDLGVGGLLAFLAWLGAGLWGAWRAYRAVTGARRMVAAGTLAALVALLLHGLVDAPLWNSKLAFVPWLLVALGVGLGGLRLGRGAGTFDRG